MVEAVLRIKAVDDATRVIDALKTRIALIDKQVGGVDKMMAAVESATKATDGMARAIGESQQALTAQREAAVATAETLERLESATSAVARAQGLLARDANSAAEALSNQGAAASRTGARLARAQHEAQGFRKAIQDALPLAGPLIIEGTKKAIEAGATTEEEIARLKAAGATPQEIGETRGRFLEFSKTHSGVLESDYLAGYRDARVIAPGEAQSMTELGARYRAALRNSGLSSSESDVGNVLRIMDELGLKKEGDREDMLNSVLKSQQAFGSQISTETMLSAYRNAKQSIYGWSPEFRDKLFPTLLQSAGQQGGTEMMTALSNYVGGHMSHAELVALTKAGFVRPQDLLYNKKTGDIKGTKTGAKLFEEDLFQSNIAQWAWDFHDKFMGRKGATDAGFNELIDRMPRNMSGLIAFLVHNEDRIKRDMVTVDKPIGLAAADDAFGANNPVAGFEALTKAITQFASAVTEPTMATIGANLMTTAHGLQAIAAAYSAFSASNPTAAKALGLTGEAAGIGGGAYLSWKLFSGIVAGMFGGGGGAAGAPLAGAAGGAAGWLRWVMAANPLTAVSALASFTPPEDMKVLQEAIAKENAAALISGSAAQGQAAAATWGGGVRGWLRDMNILYGDEAAAQIFARKWDGRAGYSDSSLDAELGREHRRAGALGHGVDVTVTGEAAVTQHLDIQISASPEFAAKLKSLADMVYRIRLGNDPGVSMPEAAPGHGAIGHM